MWTGDHRLRVRVVVTAVSIGTLVLTGCSTVEEPNPRGSPFPSRPAQIALDRIDPCGLLSSDQKAELKLSRGTATAPTVNGVRGVGCVWSSDHDTDFTAQTVRIGAEAATTEPGAAVIDVAGFGAVRSVLRDPLVGNAPACQVTIDAAPGGSIRVQAIGVEDPRPGDEEVCRLATTAATMMVTAALAESR